MLNPGAGKDNWRNSDWKAHLYRYRGGTESLKDVFTAQRRHMPFWAGGELITFIKHHGLDVDNLALVNIAWCATKKNNYPAWMLAQCLRLHTSGWLENLKPHTVILSGTASHGFEQEISDSLPDVEVHTSFHYAHRPRDADRAISRAREIASLVNAT